MFWVINNLNSFGSNLFRTFSKKFHEGIFNFVKFMATKKGKTTYLFFSSSLLLLGHPGSGIRDPAWKKSGS
jgi:hypothetical protein